MKVIRAKSAGFCFGVKRAVETVYEQIDQVKDKQIYTYGPIIHNQEVVKDLEKHGVKVVNSEEELNQLTDGLVIIRSHGVPKRICDNLKNKGISFVDATCPFVKRIHNIVAEECENGSYVIIIGDPKHPEVQGIRGWGDERVSIIQTMEEAMQFNIDRNGVATLGKIEDDNRWEGRVCVVAQTTFNYNKFKDLVEILSKKGYYISVLNTICNATKERQTEARSIAEEVDAMIVIGDKHSSNTQKLFEICRNACNNTYYIQTLGDLNLDQLESVDTVGITAGASTPNNIIEEVQNNVRINF